MEGRRIVASPFRSRVSLSCLAAQRSALYNVVLQLSIYCKRGYFRWGGILRKCWQDISRGGNFHDITHISFIKVSFSHGGNFQEEDQSTKITPTQKFPRLQ